MTAVFTHLRPVRITWSAEDEQVESLALRCPLRNVNDIGVRVHSSHS